MWRAGREWRMKRRNMIAAIASTIVGTGTSKTRSEPIQVKPGLTTPIDLPSETMKASPRKADNVPSVAMIGLTLAVGHQESVDQAGQRADHERGDEAEGRVVHHREGRRCRDRAEPHDRADGDVDGAAD